MPNGEASEQKNGAGYFARRLKESGKIEEPSKTEQAMVGQAETESESVLAPQAGQIFEESTKSIASMTGDMSETARLASAMKDGLERVTKIANMLSSDNPLCDESGCSYDGVGFSDQTSNQNLTKLESKTVNDSSDDTPLSAENEEKIASLINEYAKKNLSEMKSDADSIRQELQEFKNNIKQKEVKLAEFREHVNQTRMQTNESTQCDAESVSPLHITDQVTNENTHQLSEFDVVTSVDQSANIDSIQETQEFDKFATIQRQIKEGEKKLLELRWKIKKAEVDYGHISTQKDESENLTSEIQQLESKRNHLKVEIRNLENQNREPKQELKELEQKIEQAKKEYSEKIVAKQELDDVRSVLDYLKLDKESLKSDLEEMRSKIKTAQKEYESKKLANDELEDVRFTVSTLKAEKDTLEAELEQMHTRIKKAEAEYLEKQAEKEKIGEFKAVITHLKIEKDSIENELSDLRTRIKKAEAEYQQKRSATEELQEVRDVLAYLKPERDSLKAEMALLREKIEKLQDSYDEINAKKRELQLEYDELKFKLRKLDSEHEEKKNSFSHFTR
jgi:predicted  nucleic acid-binding Zn-ribbon protein